VKVTTPEEGVLETVPDRATLEELSETTTVADESRTGLSEISFKVTTGTVAKPALFTAPVAAVVNTILVATPWVTSTVMVDEASDKLAASAFTFLMPLDPRNLRASRVAIPAEALRTRVPVSSGDELASEIEALA
jgi:hypothetical protein